MITTQRCTKQPKKYSLFFHHTLSVRSIYSKKDEYTLDWKENYQQPEQAGMPVKGMKVFYRIRAVLWESFEKPIRSVHLQNDVCEYRINKEKWRKRFDEVQQRPHEWGRSMKAKTHELEKRGFAHGFAIGARLWFFRSPLRAIGLIHHSITAMPPPGAGRRVLSLRSLKLGWVERSSFR